MFNPKAIAIIGATPKEGKAGYSILKNLLKFKGKLYPINPKYSEIFGIKCYKSILDVDDNIDLAIIVVPNVVVPQVLEECGKKGVKYVVIISAGFSEVGNVELENKVRDILEKYNIRAIGPNCFGLINAHINLNATFSKVFPERGNISLISQSGAVIDAILDILPLLNIGVSKVVSLGNKIDIQESDILEILKDDEETRVIGIYLESLKDKNFLKVAKEVAKKKPIIVLKAGKSEAGKRAAKSHTGALAGENELYEAIFKQCGFIITETFEEFVDALHVFSTQPEMRGNKVGIITNAGGFGVLAADASESYNLELPEFSVKEELKEVLKNANISNPLDIIGDATPERYEKVVKIVMKDKNMDGYLIILTPQEMTKPLEVAEKLVRVEKVKPLVTSFIGGVSVKGAKSFLRKHGIPSYITPENGVKALSNLYKFYKLKMREENEEEIKEVLEEFLNIKEENKEEIRELIKKGDEYSIKKLLSLYNFPVPRGYIVESEEEAEEVAKKLGRVVLKALNVYHKTDVGAVIIDPEDVREAYKNLAEKFGNKILIEEYIDERGVELIFGGNRNLYPLFLVGLGGIFTEVLKDVSLAIPPVDRNYIREMLNELKGSKLLKGYRGIEVDLDYLIDLLFKLSIFFYIHDEIREIDLNPILAYKDGAKILDAKIVRGE
ncbi:acetate--CoA ligase family protein [Methanocaldococcus infernus]